MCHRSRRSSQYCSTEEHTKRLTDGVAGFDYFGAQARLIPPTHHRRNAVTQGLGGGIHLDNPDHFLELTGEQPLLTIPKLSTRGGDGVGYINFQLPMDAPHRF